MREHRAFPFAGSFVHGRATEKFLFFRTKTSIIGRKHPGARWVHRAFKRKGRDFLAHADMIEVEGEIVEARSNGYYLVKLQHGAEALVHLGGKLRRHFIRVIPGDRVTVELSPYDLTRGRITFRHKG